LRFGIGSCVGFSFAAGFSFANALHHDHSFGIAELIEVKPRQFCASWGQLFRRPDRLDGHVQQQNGPNISNSRISALKCGFRDS
jgi:hypothetical protein